MIIEIIVEIIEIAVATDDILQGNSRTVIWTDWEAFRKSGDTQQQATADKITDIDKWMRTLRNDIKTSTKKIVTNIETPQMDSRLAHLIEAKNSIMARWKKQRLSRKLRKIADINRNIEEHCHTLGRQQWKELCNEVDGQLHKDPVGNLSQELCTGHISEPEPGPGPLTLSKARPSPTAKGCGPARPGPTYENTIPGPARPARPGFSTLSTSAVEQQIT
ncbi:hypothetical protein HPB50_014232 [Hyalomma asiaticum]|uniref:Uncharacterized protein n=1 Tax=Hyalomma asiaticum TaxID=266040 RepID=A0ACB7SQV2_HYAAI|nr:hypothetical protein HPB50_014232 [Hyalomma asiaticum]